VDGFLKSERKKEEKKKFPQSIKRLFNHKD